MTATTTTTTKKKKRLLLLAKPEQRQKRGWEWEREQERAARKWLCGRRRERVVRRSARNEAVPAAAYASSPSSIELEIYHQRGVMCCTGTRRRCVPTRPYPAAFPLAV